MPAFAAERPLDSLPNVSLARLDSPVSQSKETCSSAQAAMASVDPTTVDDVLGSNPMVATAAVAIERVSAKFFLPFSLVLP